MINRITGSAVALAAMMPLAAAATEAPRTVPIYMSESGHILADVEFNGDGPFTFVLDTAAGGTVVFEDFAEDQALASYGPGTIRIQAASGAMDVALVSMGELALGEWTVDVASAVVIPAIDDLDRDHDGILGLQHLFAQPVGFDLTGGEIQIFDADEPVDATALEGTWSPVRIDQGYGGFAWVTVSINGVEIDALLDTGARRTIINNEAAAALGIDVDDPSLAEDDPILGASNEPTAAYTIATETIQLGQRARAARNITLADLAVFDALGREGQPSMIVGVDLLAEQNFVIDTVADVLWLQQRRSAALGPIPSFSVEVSSEVR